jgi:hypothetical protein
VKQNPRLQLVTDGSFQQGNERKLDPAFRQLVLNQSRAIRLEHAKVDPRVLLPHALHDGRAETGNQRFRATEAQLSCRGVGHELDLVDACLEIIKNRQATLEQGAPVWRWLYSLGAAIEQVDPEQLFEIGDHFGDDRLRNREMFGGFCHAAPFRDRHHDLEMLQLEPLTDKVRLLHDLDLFRQAIAI